MIKEMVITCPSCDGEGYTYSYSEGVISQDIPTTEYWDGCSTCGGKGSKRKEDGKLCSDDLRKGSGKFIIKFEVTNERCYKYGGIPQRSFGGSSYQEPCSGKFRQEDIKGRFLGEGVCTSCYGTGYICKVLEQKPKTGWW